MEKGIWEIIDVTVGAGASPKTARMDRLLYLVQGFFGGIKVSQLLAERLYRTLLRRLERQRGGKPLALRDVNQTLMYAERALELSKDKLRRGTLHFLLGQLYCLRSTFSSRSWMEELRQAHSHFIRSEQLSLTKEAKEAGEAVWSLLEKGEGPDQVECVEGTGEVSPLVEEGLDALSNKDLSRAQVLFGEGAPTDLQCEDRWIAASFLFHGAEAIKEGSRAWARCCLDDGARFCQQTESPSERSVWSGILEDLATEGDLLEELADTVKGIADRRMNEWLHHYDASEAPDLLVWSYDLAATQYELALSSPYTTVDRALDNYTDIMRKLAGLYWHRGDFGSVVNIGNQILTYLPKRKDDELTSFHSVLAHSYMALAHASKDDKERLLLADKAQEHVTRALRGHPESQEKHHLSPEELHRMPSPDLLFTEEAKSGE